MPTHLDPILVACLGYAGLFLGLTLLMASGRSVLVFQRKRAPNSFALDGSDLSPFMNRLTRARDNYFENMGILALIVVVASASGQLDALNGLATVFLAARIGQTAAHLASTANPVVLLRATCFSAQICIQIYWVVTILFLSGTP
jgi:uncharacterized MAPEG superfamily protein